MQHPSELCEVLCRTNGTGLAVTAIESQCCIQPRNAALQTASNTNILPWLMIQLCNERCEGRVRRDSESPVAQSLSAHLPTASLY